MENWKPLCSHDSTIFQANHQALEAHFPQVARAVREADPAGIEFLPLERGLFGLRDMRGDRTVVVHDPAQLDRAILGSLTVVKRAFEEGAWLVVMLGVGLGYVAMEAVKYLTKHHPGQAKGLLCVEPDAGILRAALTIYDLRPVIDSGRALWVTGSKTHQELRNLVEEHSLGVLDTRQVAYAAGRPVHAGREKQRLVECGRVLADALNKNRQAIAPLREQANARYAAAPVGPIRSVWSHGSTETIWGWITRDAVAGFRELGIESSMLIMNDRLFTRWYRAQADFFRRRPDALFFLNHSSEYLAAFCREYRLPRFIWYVDDPANSVAIPHHPDDYIVCVAPTFHESLEELGGRLLGDVAVGAAADQPVPTPRDRFRCSVSYVGSVRDTRAIRRQVSSSLNDWLDKVVEQRVRDPLCSSSDLLDRYPPPAGGLTQLSDAIAPFVPKSRYMRELQQVEYYLYIEANSRRRVQYMESLSGMDTAIYGPMDWTTLLPEKMRKCYRGPISSEEDLVCLYVSSAINLNINALQGFSFMNIRNFQVPMCGGFLLSEWVPCAAQYFEPEKELAFFEGIDDLPTRVRYYLDRPEKRERTVEAARLRIKAEHTYAHRVNRILDMYYNFRKRPERTSK